MRKLIELGYYYYKNYRNNRLIKSNGKQLFFESIHHYAGHEMLDCKAANQIIKNKIEERIPFCVGRFGATELFCSSMFEFDVNRKKEKAIDQLIMWSGFFPKKIVYGDRFNEIIIDSTKELDILGIWNLRFEDYYINEYANNNIKLTHLYNIEPWRNMDNPWTQSLEGKKVLVIHPFEESIKSQYSRRLEIFPDGKILPEFELITFKAVQTVAGTKDNRFTDWFDALDWMYNEIIKLDFDIAIIGCGAYGLPLAARLKRYGKQAIHLGGATQLMFGIKGKRWDEEPDKEYVRKLYNDSWVYPLETEKPKKAQIVENGCYW